MQLNFEKEQETYDETLDKMKDDMYLIKTEWQKKCQEISNT